MKLLLKLPLLSIALITSMCAFALSPTQVAPKVNDGMHLRASAMKSDLALSARGIASPQKTVYDLIGRITPGYESQYRLEIIPAVEGCDVYEIDGNGKNVILRGNNAISLSSAFNWYLKYTCKAHLSWFGNQLNLPKQLPQPIKKERKVIKPKYRVYMNYCTVSYTAPWWKWERWQQELDYMAMNGVNMPLFSVGLSGVWYNTLLRFGFSDTEAREFLVGPAHQAWQWMQNIEGYGAPLPKSVIDKQVALGKQIVNRMLEFGMQPIQQGFSGYVPNIMKEKYPQSRIRKKKNWCGFKHTSQLDPTDPLFREIGLAFMQEQDKLFGSHGVYAADPFHESKPPIHTPEYLSSVGKSIHNLFQEFDKGSIWAMQAWSLREEIVKAVPIDNLLILDLNGAKLDKRQGYWGYHVVVGLLHNFGGRINLHGDLAGLASNPFKESKRHFPNVCGTGLFMEGIHQNPVFYDLAFEMWHHEGSIPIDKWVAKYAERRYGAPSAAAKKAMLALLNGPYTKDTNGTEFSSIVAARPAIDVKKSGPNAGFSIPYDPALLLTAEKELLKDAGKLSASKPYRFDVVDIQRQIMSNLGQAIHKQAATAFKVKDKKAFALHANRFLEMLQDLDELLSTRKEYSLDCWLTDARSWGNTKTEKDLLERDATSLVTIWGPDDAPAIFDYAWREWGGLVKGFYLPRWQQFYAMLQKHLDNGTEYGETGLKLQYKREAFRANEFYNQLADWEMSYVNTYNKARIPNIKGDEIEIASHLFTKYEKLFHEYMAMPVRSEKVNKNEHTFENLGEEHTDLHR